MRKGLAVRGPLIAVAGALACWLLLAAPASAEQAPDPLAALTRAGAPLVASAPPSSAGPTPPARPMVASTADPVAPATHLSVADKAVLGLTMRQLLSAVAGLALAHGAASDLPLPLQLLTRQDSSTAGLVAETFGLSAAEREFLLACRRSEGLFLARGNHIALRVEASPLEHALATTDPEFLASGVTEVQP